MSEETGEYVTDVKFPSTNPEQDLDIRELKVIEVCLKYADDPIGMPNHLLMIIIAKLWKRLVHLCDLWESLDQPEVAEGEGKQS